MPRTASLRGEDAKNPPAQGKSRTVLIHIFRRALRVCQCSRWRLGVSPPSEGIYAFVLCHSRHKSRAASGQSGTRALPCPAARLAELFS